MSEFAPSRLLWIVLLAVVAAPSSGAQALRLNDALAREVDADVIDYLITPDGQRVVLRADVTTNGVYDLFSAPADGSGPAVRLNDPLPPLGNVGGAVINAFGSGGGWDYGASSTGWVVFLADVQVNDADELYGVPADGSAGPIQLNGALAPGQRVQRFWILPAGQDVLYLAEELGDIGLFRVPIDGSAAPEALTPGVVPLEVWIAPDGGRVAYTLPTAFPYRTQLWSVPTDGSAAPIQLAITPPPTPLGFTGIDRLDITDDGTQAVFHEVLNEDDTLLAARVRSVPLDGGHAPITLNQSVIDPYASYAFDGGGRVLFRDPSNLFSVSLDGTQHADLTPAGWTPEDDLASFTVDGAEAVFAVRAGSAGALYRAPIDGAQPAQQVLVSATRIRTFQLTPSSIVFTTNGAPSEFLSVPLTGGAPVLLNPAPFDAGALDYRVHPGGDELLFRAQPGGTGKVQLYAVPLDASTLPRRLNANLISAGDVERYTLSEDGARVVYRADQLVNEALELFGLPFAGGPVVPYNPPFPSGPVVGDVQSFLVSPDETRLLYRADQDLDEVFGLYLTRPDGRGTARSLTSLVDEQSSVFTGYAFTPDAARVVFLQAESPGSASGDLYSIAVSPSSAPILLDDRGRIYEQQLVVDPPGTRVVYRRQRTLSGEFYDLCSSRVDGSAELALTLTPPSGNVSAFRLTPDGAAAIYLADHDVAGVIELYRVPLDGSAPAQRLHPAMPAGGDVSAFALTPDGQQVVFLADAVVDEEVELYVVPSDGSAPPVRRSGALVAGGDVTHFVVAPDGASVVYRADQRVDETFELFAFPLAGGPDVVVAPLPPGSLAEADFALSADGQHVVYRADANAPAVIELFRAPVDGSASPTRLSAPLVAGGDVLAFAVAGDLSRVVYRADQRLDDVFELYSVPLSGGPSTPLQTLPASADVTGFRIAPDSGTVFFRADTRVDEVFELYGAPLDGSAPARRATFALPSHADVLTDFVPLSAGRVLHRVDYEEDGVLELYVGFLERSIRRAETPTRTVVR